VLDDAPVGDATAWLERARGRFVGPEVTIGITDCDGLVGTVADSRAKRPIPDDELFLIASVSKSFTAALVMQEAAAGHLALDDPVTKFLPWFTPRNPSAPIEIQHLLTHTAGISTGYDISGDAVEELLLLREEVVASVPGTHHVYSNAGYKALGLILEHVTGRPWWELARERILDPLGMSATEPVITGDVRPKLAQGWVPPLDDRPWHPDHGLVHAPWYESYTADGTIASNATDMASYVRMYLNDGGEVLRKEDVDRMTTGDIDDPDTGSRYGFGLWVLERDGHRLVGHSGSLPGFRSMILFDRERGFGAAMMTNGAVSWDLRVDLLAAAIDAAASDDAPALPPRTSLRTFANAEGAAGTYTDGDTSLTFEVEDDGLVLVTDDGRDRLVVSGDALVTSLAPWDHHRFTFEGEGERFDAVANGSRVFHREGSFVLPAPPAPSVWSSYAGRYRAYGIEPMHVEVLERAGRLFLVDEHAEDESELIPLDARRFRVGAESWQPGRARFEAPVGDEVRRLILDGAVFVRVP
jgi:CubicO group peptidase (beta-lactamase class C family)